MKKTATAAVLEKKPRQRYVLGSSGPYYLYCRNFLFTPESARRLDRPDQFRSIRPETALVVLLPSWTESATRIPGLFSVTCDYKAKWRDIGTEEISQEELVGGIPARQANLLKKYRELTDRAGTNYLAIESGKDWIRRLDQQDQDLLVEALGLREKGQDPGA